MNNDFVISAGRALYLNSRRTAFKILSLGHKPATLFLLAVMGTLIESSSIKCQNNCVIVYPNSPFDFYRQRCTQSTALASRTDWNLIINGLAASSSYTDIHDIAANYFGPGVDPALGAGSSPASWDGTSTIHCTGITYTAAPGDNYNDWVSRVPGSISCSDGFTAHDGGKGHRSAQDDGTPDSTCKKLRDSGIPYNQNGMYQVAYDTLTHFIERCANSTESWRAFVYLHASVQDMSSDLNRFFVFRDWLKSVLYLNTTDPMYYCQCVQAIMFTYQWNGPTRGADQNAGLAIVKYLMDSKKCPMDSAQLADQYTTGRQTQLQDWRDTCQTCWKTPLDTTLPTLEQLGMEILRGPTKVVNASNANTYVLSLSASENPIHPTTTLMVDLGTTSYIRYQVFDELGRWVAGWEHGEVLPAGKHSIPLDLSTKPAGVYYARISTGYGLVRTVKLVRQ